MDEPCPRSRDRADDRRLQYALEWGFFTRCQWGEYDTAVYDLERTWAEAKTNPNPATAFNRANERPVAAREPTTVGCSAT